MESTATLDAISPAAWPPIPSATTKRRCSGLAIMLSSLPLRLRPTSVNAWYAIFMQSGSFLAEGAGRRRQ